VTHQQDEITSRFLEELVRRGHDGRIDWNESDAPESRNFLFGEVEGVTVTVTPGGLINIPAVRTYHPPKYPTPVIAAASARELWAKLKARDDVNLELAKTRQTGHLGPIIDHDLRCRNKLCPCNSETQDVRRKRERGGFNEDPFRCS
jgi:hypothetical protein